MASEVQQGEAGDLRERRWKGNLVGAASAVFALTFGAMVATPLLPTFLYRELEIVDVGELAFWSGTSSAVGSIMSAAFAPLWGTLADRFGRRPLLIRALVGASALTAALAAVQSTGQLLLARAVGGVVGGVQPATVALVASETPPRLLGRALGLLSTARALGQTIGPAVGGVVAGVLSARAIFVVAGAIVLAGLGPVLAAVRETQVRTSGTAQPKLGAVLRGAGPAVRRAILVLVAVQGLTQLALSGFQQLVLVRFIELDPASGALGGGIALAALSLANATAGAAYPSALPRLGYRGVGILAALILGAAEAMTSGASSVAALVVTSAAVGVGYGAVTPAVASMLGLESPAEVRGAVFGVSSSAQYVGTAGGALCAGVAGAALGPAGGLLVVAASALGAAVVLALGAREPIVR